MDISDYCLLVTRTTPQGEKAGRHHQSSWSTPRRRASRSARSRRLASAPSAPPRSSTTTPECRDRHARRGGQGLGRVDACLWYERLVPVGGAHRCRDGGVRLALDYAKTRKQFGQPIGKFQAISHKLADMKVMLDVSRDAGLPLRLADGRRARRRGTTLRCSSSIPSEAYKSVADMGLQILGGYGYCMEYPMQRFFRDSRLATIGAGTRKSSATSSRAARGGGL
jgi:acyl-CoA dehydrogenase